MAKAEIKTKAGSENVTDFLNNIKEEQKRADSFAILKMMQDASGEEPAIWGGSMIGFGKMTYKSPATGREVDWFRIGFAPRKANISLYLSLKIDEYENELKKLGKHKTGVGCLYINKLADVDVKVLQGIIKETVKKRPK